MSEATPEQKKQLVTMALELQQLIEKWKGRGIEENVISTATLSYSVRWAVKCEFGIAAFLTEVRRHWTICESMSKGKLELNDTGREALARLKAGKFAS